MDMDGISTELSLDRLWIMMENLLEKWTIWSNQTLSL